MRRNGTVLDRRRSARVRRLLVATGLAALVVAVPVVGAYAEDGYRSVADVVDGASLQKVRDFKKQKKAEAKAQAG